MEKGKLLYCRLVMLTSGSAAFEVSSFKHALNAFEWKGSLMKLTHRITAGGRTFERGWQHRSNYQLRNDPSGTNLSCQCAKAGVIAWFATARILHPSCNISAAEQPEAHLEEGKQASSRPDSVPS